MTGQEMYDFAGSIFNMPRSLTGAAVRETLDRIGEKVPLFRYYVPSGSKVYDWTVPAEWNVQAAYLEGPKWRVSREDNFLHLLGYSIAIDRTVPLGEANHHVYTGSSIPYVTSYYEPRWGFCMTDDMPIQSGEKYHAYVDATHDEHGQLDYADLVIPGDLKDEILFSTYTCHPNLANDNVSGMVVQTALAEWIASEPRKYTYRFVWCPETIGALVYLSRHLEELQERVRAGFVLNCIGDDRAYSMQDSRTGNTDADRVGRAALSVERPYGEAFERAWSAHESGDRDWPWPGPEISARGRSYGWMERGSDERQYCSPLADLPVAGLSRSRWGSFPEYHTSADNMDVISPEGLEGGLGLVKRCVRIIEGNGRFRAKFVGDVQLGDRGLYSTLGHGVRDKRYQHVLSYCDGELDAIDIAERTRMTPEEVIAILTTLSGHGLVEAV